MIWPLPTSPADSQGGGGNVAVDGVLRSLDSVLKAIGSPEGSINRPEVAQGTGSIWDPRSLDPSQPSINEASLTH